MGKPGGWGFWEKGVFFYEFSRFLKKKNLKNKGLGLLKKLFLQLEKIIFTLPGVK